VSTPTGNSALSRREFLAATAAGAVVCAGLAGCRTLNADARLLETPVENGRALLGDEGALAVGEQLKVAVQGADHVVLVARVSETEFHAVQISCTHFGSEVALADGGTKFRCTNHGAEFDLAGQVLKGPASNPLQSYAVTSEEGKLYLTVPS